MAQAGARNWTRAPGRPLPGPGRPHDVPAAVPEAATSGVCGTRPSVSFTSLGVTSSASTTSPHARFF